MPTPFAYPVSDDAPSAVAGRDFRQALHSGSGDKVPGLEVFLPASDHRLFACLTGALFWEPASGAKPNRLLLRPSRTAVSFLKEAKAFESPPAELVYENVDQTAVENAIHDVLLAAYDATDGQPPANWHPSMKQIAGTGARARQNLQVRFGDAREANATQIAATFVSSPARSFYIEVVAGDHIGAADVFPGSGPPGHPRQLIFYTIDFGQQLINPLYYLFLYANVAQAELLSDLSKNPLLPAFPTLGGPQPPARLKLPAPKGGDEFPFPLGPHLQTPHGKPSSPFNWLYTDAGKIAIEGEGELVPNSVPGLPDFSEVDRLWTNHGAELARQCEYFQIPCEMAVAIFSTESGGNGRAYRLEVMRDEWVGNAGSRPDLLFMYAQVLGTLVMSYTPTRLAGVGPFGEQVVTSLAVELLEEHAISEKALIPTKSRYVFIDNGIFQPNVVSHSSSGAFRSDYRIDIAEEHLTRTIHQDVPTDTFYHPAPSKVPAGSNPPGLSTPVAASTSITYVSDRGGKVHVMRAKLASPLSFDLLVTLFVRNTAGAIPVQLRIPAQSTVGSSTLADVDVQQNDSVALRVERDPPTAPGAFDLSVEWFLGVEGADGAPFSPPSMFIVAGGRGGPASGLTQLGPQWDDSLAVRPGRPMTFGDLTALVELTGGGHISPGLTQTTIPTALEYVRRMHSRGLRAIVDVPNVTNARDMLRGSGTELGWLFTPKNAIFAALAKMRDDYLTRGTWFDLPRLAAAYYGGMRTKAARWGFDLPGRYGDIVGRRLNAIIERFDAPGSLGTPPTVRFRK